MSMSTKRSPLEDTGRDAKLPKLDGFVKHQDAPSEEQKHKSRRGDIKCPTVMYKDGEPLAGLQEIFDAPGNGDKLAEVLIPSDYMTSGNRRVKTRQLWGDCIYTSDSDVVAVLMHLGYFPHYLPSAPPQVQELHVLLRLVPPQQTYPSKARFLKSRAWCSPVKGCAFQVEGCWLITRSGTTIDLDPSVSEVPAPYPTVNATLNRPQNTRSTGRGGVKVGQEVSVQYNLCNEPWLKYTLAAIADRGLKPPHWTSARLLTDVLLLETATQRYQVHRTGGAETSSDGAAPPAPPSASASASAEPVRDVYTLSRCLSPLPMGVLVRLGVPLVSPLHAEVVEEGMGWEELQWGVSGVVVRGRELMLKRLHFVPMAPNDRARGGAELLA
ncbi:hypothetical protein FOA52_000156 [Chlamydomonas sp. UWO 241]|nr:hypothetical protein FOA52_000156 [Chlamydomonas sp. UWO 241]